MAGHMQIRKGIKKLLYIKDKQNRHIGRKTWRTKRRRRTKWTKTKIWGRKRRKKRMWFIINTGKRIEIVLLKQFKVQFTQHNYTLLISQADASVTHWGVSCYMLNFSVSAITRDACCQTKVIQRWWALYRVITDFHLHIMGHTGFQMGASVLFATQRKDSTWLRSKSVFGCDPKPVLSSHSS